jgi:hypothetical protein
MRKSFQLFVLFASCIIFKQTSAQILDPVHWSFRTTEISDCEFELIVQAKLDAGWHLYGQKPYGDDGPVPTSFHYMPNPNYELIGTTSEETLIKKFEPVFNLELNYFEHEAFFKQKVEIKSDQPIEIKGNFEFMVCNDVTCMPPATVPFSFKIQCSRKTPIALNFVFFVILLVFSISLLGGRKIAWLSNVKFNVVKVVIGFLSLAFALKFASNIDLLLHTGIITREVFISLWVVIFALLGIYLLGGIKFSKDNAFKYVNVPRLFFAILILSFTVYLIPGLWGAPLKLISGFLPRV